MRALWVCNVAGGPFEYIGARPGSTRLGREVARRNLEVYPEQFDEVAGEMARTRGTFKVPKQETGEVLSAFAAHTEKVTQGYSS